MKYIKKYSLELILLSAIYYLLVTVYTQTLPVVNYMWKQKIEFSLEESLNSYCLLLLLYIFTIPLEKVYKISYRIVIFLFYMPIFAVSSVITIDESYVYILTFYIIIGILTLLIVQYLSRPQTKNIKQVSFDEEQFFYFVKIISVLLLFVFIVSNYSSINLNLLYVFNNVYLIRESNQSSIIDAYLTRFMVSILSPILICIAFKKKDPKAYLLALINSYILFSVYAMKIQFLYFFLYSFFGYLAINRKIEVSNIVLGFIASVVLSSLFLGTLGYNLLDRFIYLPALLNLLYIDFFLHNPLNYFEFSKLEIFFGGSNYTQTLGYIIDTHYFGGGMNANTGFIGSFFAELGYWGLVMCFFIFNLFLYFIRIIESKVKYLGVMIAISFSFELMNAPITNLFFTNSFYLLILLPFILRGEKGKNANLKLY